MHATAFVGDTAGSIVLNYERAESQLDLTDKIELIITDNAGNMIYPFHLAEFERKKKPRATTGRVGFRRDMVTW